MAPGIRFFSILVPATMAGGCEPAPTYPSPERYALSRLQVTCRTADVQVRCAATLYDVPRWGSSQDVTADASWILSDQDVGTIERGPWTPTRRGEVAIRAGYDRFVSDTYSLTFLVDPSQPAQYLYSVSGIVRDAVTNRVIESVTVEIVDGYNRGEPATTNRFGHYSIRRILTSVDFRARASKEGYEVSIATHRVDPPFGLGNPPVLDFRLIPVR